MLPGFPGSSNSIPLGEAPWRLCRAFKEDNSLYRNHWSPRSSGALRLDFPILGVGGVFFVATSPHQIHQNPTFYTSWGSLSFFLLKMNNKILRFHSNGVSGRCLAFYS